MLDNESVALAPNDSQDEIGIRRRSLDTLLSRQSIGQLQEPAPDDADLALILDAGLRAPDHGRLRPWQFILIRGGARRAFAEILCGAMRSRDATSSDAAVERLRARILTVPLWIGVAVKVKADAPIPEIEQILSAGAAVMNLLNAIHALGYGGMWVTGPHVYDSTVNEALGLTMPDRLIGLLQVGSAQATRPVSRPERSGFVREWTGREG